MTPAQPPRPRSALEGFAPYEWELSTEVVAARLGRHPSEIVRFDTNTVPWRLPQSPPSIAGVNEYPDASYSLLVGALSAYCHQPPDRIVVGAGADELISLVAQAYLDASRTFAVSDPTYSMFVVSSRLTGATPLRVPCGDDLGLDHQRFAAAVRSADVSWLANPSNPTGELLTQARVREIASMARGLLVVDEAYAEFVDSSSLEWIDEVRNVVVIRTLSKAFGLAGARVGYLVAGPEVVAALNLVRPVSSIAVTSAALAVDALERAGEMRANVRGLIVERARLAAALRRSGRRVIEGSANFVLAEAGAADVDRALSAGLVMRTYGEGHRLQGLCRVTVRSPSENDRLLAAWQHT